MSDDPTTRRWIPVLHGPVGVALGALAPTVVFVLAALIAGPGSHNRSVSTVDLLAAVPLYLAFVSIPSLVPVIAAGSVSSRIAATAAMSAVAGWAGVAVVRTDDAQAGLAVLIVPVVAVPLGLVFWVGRSIVERRGSRAFEVADVSHRAAARSIDIVLAAVLLLAPATMLSHASREVVAGVVVVVGTTALWAGTEVWWRGSPGKRVLRLRVVGVDGLVPLSGGRLVLRSLVVVFEVAMAATVFLAPLLVADLMTSMSTGRSFADRLVGSTVVTSE